jgi:hypothetical protein
MATKAPTTAAPKVVAADDGDNAFLPRLTAVASDMEALLDRLMAPDSTEGEIQRPARARPHGGRRARMRALLFAGA